jgi:hypothetical protein
LIPGGSAILLNVNCKGYSIILSNHIQEDPVC